jgi:hypothetical protein
MGGVFIGCSLLVSLTTAGCSWHQPPGNGATQQGSSESASKPAAQSTMSPSQKLGVSVLTALNTALKNPRISVGTTKNTIILNGTVNSEAERRRALAIAKQKGAKYKIEDHLKVAATPAKPLPVNKPVKNQKNQ